MAQRYALAGAKSALDGKIRHRTASAKQPRYSSGRVTATSILT